MIQDRNYEACMVDDHKQRALCIYYLKNSMLLIVLTLNQKNVKEAISWDSELLLRHLNTHTLCTLSNTHDHNSYIWLKYVTDF